MLIKAGTSNVSTIVRYLLSASGTPASQLTSVTPGLDMWYRRDGSPKTLLSAINLATVDSAHADGGFIHIQDGYYRVDVPDAAVGSGAQGVLVGGSATGFTGVGTYIQLDAPVDIAKISGDAVAADNLELQYDTTGLTGDTFPAKQSQVENIAVTGAAVNAIPASYTLTTGTQSSGTIASAQALDAVTHQHTDTGGAMELYYEFTIGGDGIPTSVTAHGFLTGINDTLTVWAYNWGDTAWNQIGTLAGGVSATIGIGTYSLLAAHVGTGANLGKVRIRYYAASGLTTATLGIDYIYVSYAIVRRSVGYADGAIWIDTTLSNENTESYVDGTADNPVSTLAAALTLSGQLNIKKFHVANGSTITLSGDSSNYVFYGDNWTLDLNGQTITNAHFNGASVSGTATGTGFDFHECELNSMTIAAGDFFNCAIAGDIILTSAATYSFDQCFSGVAGNATPGIDFGATVADTNLNMRHYSGGIEVRNMGASANDRMSLEGWGQLVAASTCLGGSVSIRGNFTITDQAGGAIKITDGARYDVTQIRDEASAALSTYDPPTNAEFEARTLAASDIFLFGTDRVMLTTATASQIDNIANNASALSDSRVPDIISLANIRAEASGALGVYDAPTNAEMNARTILSAEYATSALLPSLSAGLMPATVEAINGSTSAAGRLRLSTLTMVPGTATAHQLSTSQMSNNLAETTDDHYNGRIILWTSGNLKNQATDITDYTGFDGTSALLTFTAVTEAPANNNTFIIL